MSTRIFVFNPLSEQEVKTTESEIDALMNKDWEIVSAVSGAGEDQSYVMLVLRKISTVPMLPHLQSPHPQENRAFGYIR